MSVLCILNQDATPGSSGISPRWLVLDYPDRRERRSWGEADLGGVEEVRVEGDGWTFDASGQRISSPFVMQVNLDLSLGRLSLNTWSDAWLPVDLAGRPQPEVYARNAPRLRAALTEATRQTGWRLSAGQCDWTRVDVHGVQSRGDTPFSYLQFLREIAPWNEQLRQPPDCLFFSHDVGLANAPDARSGRHLLVLSPDGRAGLEHWQQGQYRRHSGWVNPQILRRILEILVELQFPEIPSQPVMAGPSFRAIEVTGLGLAARLTLSRIHAEKHEPTRELCEWVDSVMAALRGEPLPGYRCLRPVALIP